MQDLSDKKILVLYTGGTIGMIVTQQGYDFKKGYLTETIQSYSSFYDYGMPKFVVREYNNLIDSSNINPRIWLSLALDIIKDYENYDGFIVLHGTDTLAYTASVLSFMLGEIQKPVIVTGSQIPISQTRSDAIPNILNSLILACSDLIKEVCVFFNQKLMRANRTTKISATDFNAFDSPNYPSLAKVGVDITLNKKILWQRSLIYNKPKLETFKVPKVAILNIFPGIDNTILQRFLELSLQGLVLRTYGTGNMIDDPEIHATLAKANDMGLVMVNCTQCLYGSVKMNIYKNARGLKKAGIVSGYDMTDEAALAKLFYLLSQPNISHQNVKDAFSRSLQGEVSTDYKHD